MIVSRYGTRTSSVSTLTPNLRASRSRATATWVSPQPRSTVWPVSSLRSTTSAGSSASSRCRAPDSLSSSDWVTGFEGQAEDGVGGGRAARRAPASPSAPASMPVGVSAELGDGADVAGDDLVGGEVLLAAQVEQAVHALLGAARAC